MAIGLRKNWKQPMAYYFSGACVTADRLAVLIKEVLSACFCSGLEVVGVVSDMDGVNMRAINCLGSTISRPYFEHEGHEIVTICDPPHLLKCFRNNFMKHDIQFNQETQIEGTPNQVITRFAKWSHIEEFYKLDKDNPNFVYAPGLTQHHLQPNGKQKMKVRLAAQVLSHSVASGIYAKVANNTLPQDASGTAEIVSQMDKLFDCMNGTTADRNRGKPCLTNMSSTSPHLEHFKKMKKIFSEMKFLGTKRKPPSQEGWLRTLNGIERIYHNIKKYNLGSLSVRRISQDPLENCFGCIRSNCGCNQNPTSCQFIAALKTSMITNLINNNTNRNCMDDDNDVLHNFKIYLSSASHEKSTSSTSCPADVCVSVEEMDNEAMSHVNSLEMNDIPQCSDEMQACAYVCGFIVRKVLTNCEDCKFTMLADANSELFHVFTSFKEYDDVKCSLNYVKYSFCEMVENAANVINSFLKIKSHEDKIKLNLRTLCENLNKSWLDECHEHKEKNFKIIIATTIAICLKRFLKLKNQEFSEEASKQALKRKINILKHV